MNLDFIIKVAILDDYQNVALNMADWSPLAQMADVTVFNDHVADTGDLIQRLQPFDVVCVMRERTPLSRVVIESLPNLKLIASTGAGNASIDQDAAAERGIEIRHTGYSSTPTIEFTWALILGTVRNNFPSRIGHCGKEGGRLRSMRSSRARRSGCRTVWARRVRLSASIG